MKLLLLFVALFGALWPAAAQIPPVPPFPVIDTNALLGHIRTLASDEFEGRAPASRGEELTVRYLLEQFQKAGLKPGHPDGGWTQEVPMVGVKSAVSFKLSDGKTVETLAAPQDFVAWSPRVEPEVKVTASELVFCGYGITAPEFQWDDFKGADVRGKTVIVLIGDPPIPDARDTNRLDERVFKGKAMTYSGRWTYKFEEAARRGAAAALIIHETQSAGYPWFVVVNSWGRERFALQDDREPKVSVAGWLSRERAQQLFAARGLSLEALQQAAAKRDFQPVPLGVRADFTVTQTTRTVRSKNVLAKLDGADPKLRDEWVIFSAHWDHLGRNDKLAGDQVFNGALDNATGTAGLLELARVFAQAPRPARSVLFFAPTAEEQGLLGAKFYAAHPAYPLARTLANINMDGLNPRGRTHNVAVIGYGNSTLEDLLRRAAAAQSRTVETEETPEKGYFYRSDHFEFAKVGVPALYAKSGLNFRDRPAGWGRQKHDEYTERDYHKVSDEIKADWDLAGGAEDLQLLYAVGRAVAEDAEWPVWKPGAEFKTAREESLKAGRKN